MSVPRGELFDRLEMLDRLRPVQGTGRDKELLAQAWDKAWSEMVDAAKAWLAEDSRA